MKLNKRNTVKHLCAMMLVGIAFVSSAQQTPPAGQQEIERIQKEYSDQLRRSRLVGSNDSPTIELPNGELINVARKDGCSPPQYSGSMIKVDCTTLDGPAYYFDELTREIIEVCSFWVSDPRSCPPKGWPIEVSGCTGNVPQGITGSWQFYAVPTAGGFIATGSGWTMTLTEESILFDFYGIAQAERLYTVIERDDQRYVLEIRDNLAETRSLNIELAPCGLFVEAVAVCDAFCENIAKEYGTPTDVQLREILTKSLGDKFQEEALEQILKMIPDADQRRQQQPQPIFPARAFFREVIDD